jgi:TonB family protein
MATHPLSPSEARYLRIYETYPPLPSPLVRRGRSYLVAVQICVGIEGRVDNALLDEGADQELDAAVLAAVRTWRYRPLLVAGVARPFCHRIRITYEVQ